MVWQARRTRFYPREQELPGEQCWLIVARNPLTGETKYFLSNACEHTSFEVLLHVAFSRWRIERIFEDGKGQIGFDHFEVRNYLPLMRHLIPSMVSLLFLTQQTHRLREKKHPVERRSSAHRDRSAVGYPRDPAPTQSPPGTSRRPDRILAAKQRPIGPRPSQAALQST